MYLHSFGPAWTVRFDWLARCWGRMRPLSRHGAKIWNYSALEWGLSASSSRWTLVSRADWIFLRTESRWRDRGWQSTGSGREFGFQGSLCFVDRFWSNAWRSRPWAGNKLRSKLLSCMREWTANADIALRSSGQHSLTQREMLRYFVQRSSRGTLRSECGKTSKLPIYTLHLASR